MQSPLERPTRSSTEHLRDRRLGILVAMCRAVWVMIVAPTTDASKALRRAAGPDAQVVAMATSPDEALALIASSPADVVVVDAALDGARELISFLSQGSSPPAIVWVGPAAPDGAHASIDEAPDALEGAITRALLAARAAK